jgi:hypothetical protein
VGVEVPSKVGVKVGRSVGVLVAIKEGVEVGVDVLGRIWVGVCVEEAVGDMNNVAVAVRVGFWVGLIVGVEVRCTTVAGGADWVFVFVRAMVAVLAGV